MEGILRIPTTSGGGFAENGDPIPVTEGQPIDLKCQIIPTKGHLVKYEDGQYVDATFEIQLSMDYKDVIVPGVIELVDSRGREFGKHNVLFENIRFLDAVQRIQVLI